MGLSLDDTFKLVRRKLRKIGVQNVILLSNFHDICLVEIYEELTDILSKMGVINSRDENIRNCENESVLQTPLLTSFCPGVVCYLEKSYPKLISHLSATKPPQEIAGQWWKEGMYLTRNNKLDWDGDYEFGEDDIEMEGSEMEDEMAGDDDDDLMEEKERKRRRLTHPNKEEKEENGPNKLENICELLHVSVMPCFDKKIEGKRKEFIHPYDNVDESWNEVDLVLTTSELQNVLNGIFLRSDNDQEEEEEEIRCEEEGLEVHCSPFHIPTFHKISSQGFVEYCAQRLVQELLLDEGNDSNENNNEDMKIEEGVIDHQDQNQEEEMDPFPYEVGRNVDFETITIPLSTNQNPNNNTQLQSIRFVRAYGFRNIQKIVR